MNASWDTISHRYAINGKTQTLWRNSTGRHHRFTIPQPGRTKAASWAHQTKHGTPRTVPVTGCNIPRGNGQPPWREGSEISPRTLRLVGISSVDGSEACDRPGSDRAVFAHPPCSRRRTKRPFPAGRLPCPRDRSAPLTPVVPHQVGGVLFVHHGTILPPGKAVSFGNPSAALGVPSLVAAHTSFAGRSTSRWSQPGCAAALRTNCFLCPSPYQ